MENYAYEHAQLGGDTKSLSLQDSGIASFLWPDSYLPCAPQPARTTVEAQESGQAAPLCSDPGDVQGTGSCALSFAGHRETQVIQSWVT